MFDILRNPKNAVKNMALNNKGSVSMSQLREMRYKVLMSNTPLGVGRNLELIEMLRMYLDMALSDNKESESR